ncbi:MAG: acyltransferase [Opitutales bacterium]|nr:acyltransferase [Opitutales bacterium]
MDKISSERITLLRFPLMIMVLVAHASGETVNLNGVVYGYEGKMTYLTWLSSCIVGQYICRLAVPVFLIISAYFLFKHAPWSPAEFVTLLRKKARSLALPYFVWNIIAYGSILLLYAFRGQPLVSADDSVARMQILNGVGLGVHLAAFQLWFLRDLLILILFSPLIYLAIKHIPKIYFAVLFAVWAFKLWPLPVPCDRAIVHFSIGAWLAINKKNLFQFDAVAPALLLPYLLYLYKAEMLPKALKTPFYCIGILMGVILLLWATKLLYKSPSWIKGPLLYFSGASFFIFLVHEPLILSYSRALAYTLMDPMTPTEALVVMFSVPCILTVALALVHKGLCVTAPRLEAFLTGGR